MKIEDEDKQIKKLVAQVESGKLGIQASAKACAKVRQLGNQEKKQLAGYTKQTVVETNDDKEVPYSRDKNGKDINNEAKI